MIKQTKVFACMLTALLMFGMTSLPAQAGTLTIYNKNCTKTHNFATKKRVKVHVYGKLESGCTTREVTVRQGQSRTLDLVPTYKDNGLKKDCFYFHEANGTVGGKQDVNGTRDSHVTCKKDWAHVCQCKLDT